MSQKILNSPSFPAIVALVLGTATIAGAWFFELVIGLAPCPMCLTQRWPYYIGLPILALALVLINSSNKTLSQICLAAAAVLFVAGAAYGIYHSGVEWRLWEGPSGCSGGEELSADVGNLLQELSSAKVVSCVDAAWRFLGLSLAGYNVIISITMAALSVMTIMRLRKF